MNRRFVFYVLMSLMPLFLVCEKEMVSVKRTNATLRAEYVGVTEAWLKLQAHGANCGVQIKRDNQVIFRTAEINKDTVVYDSTLSPAHTYNYTLLLQDGRGEWRKAQELQITTMDTTSHDFQWEVVEFPSPFGSGIFYDVAIIDENDIWAVGAIFSDSTKPWLPYNAVHWDGNKWKLQKIFVNYKGQPNLAPLEGIFVFPEDKIIFSSGLPYLPENNHWRLYHLWDMEVLDQNDGSVNCIWGTSFNNLYFAGMKGTIVHYNGNNWYKIESGTKLTISDIWGAKKFNSDKPIILATARKLYSYENPKVLQIYDNTVSHLPITGLPLYINSCWSANGRRWYIAGYGVYKSKDLSKGWRKVWELSGTIWKRIRGSDINNIFVVGQNGAVAHWNGVVWYNYPPTQGTYEGLAVQENLVVAVGYISQGGIIDHGVILIGRRSE